MGGMPTEDLSRLARAVKQRRIALYPSRIAAAQEVGISKDTWQRVEEAQPARARSYTAIDLALGWAPGSCESVLAGGEPVTVEQSVIDPAVTLADVQVSGRAAAAQRIVESATLATVDGMTADKIRELSARITQDLQREGFI